MFNFSLFKTADEAAPAVDPSVKIDSLVQQMGTDQKNPAAGGDAISEVPLPADPAAGATKAPPMPELPATDPVKELANRLKGMLDADEGDGDGDDADLEEESDAHIEEAVEVDEPES